MDNPSKPARGQSPLPCRFENGDDATNLQRLGNLGFRITVAFSDDLELRLHQLQLATVVLYPPVRRYHLAGLEFVFQVRGIEPNALQARATLARSHLKNGHAA